MNFHSEAEEKVSKQGPRGVPIFERKQKGGFLKEGGFGKCTLVLGFPRGATEYETPSKLEIRKKSEKKYKIPALGPENTEKIQRNYKNGHFLTVFVIFVYFFHIFGSQPGMGDFVFFSYLFVFPVLRGFRILSHPVEIPTLVLVLGPRNIKIIVFFCQGSTAGKTVWRNFGTGEHLLKPPSVN